MNAHQQAAWIEHKGGGRPAEATGRVDVRFRGGVVVDVHGMSRTWRHAGRSDDIVAWRPHVAAQPVAQPAQQVPQAVIDAITAYGDARADDADSGAQLANVIRMLRQGDAVSAPAAPQPSDELAALRSDAMTMAMRLYAESDDTFVPETREVMARWRPLVNAEAARIAAGGVVA